MNFQIILPFLSFLAAAFVVVEARYYHDFDPSRFGRSDSFVNHDISCFGHRKFNVFRYGAVSDGTTDNKQAFTKAWDNACSRPGRNVVSVPSGEFLLSNVVFAGPCKGSIVFSIKGTLVANSTVGNQLDSDAWISFRHVDNLTVDGAGTGTLNGQGQLFWKYNTCKKDPNCRGLPATMKFGFVTNSRIQNIRSVNSKGVHMDLFGCENVNVTHVTITAPGDSPNTDGIKIGTSKGILVYHSTISTGDDCVAVIRGSHDVDVYRVICGPGHGISIGSIGWGSHEYVDGVTVRGCSFTGTTNGVRIKTRLTSVYSQVSNVVFENLIMKDVKNPILIDQVYCPNKTPCKGNSNVQVEGVTFQNIHGTSATKSAVTLMCSPIVPCRNITLSNINLAYTGGEGKAISTCKNAEGAAYGKVLPGGCF